MTSLSAHSRDPVTRIRFTMGLYPFAGVGSEKFLLPFADPLLVVQTAVGAVRVMNVAVDGLRFRSVGAASAVPGELLAGVRAYIHAVRIGSAARLDGFPTLG